MLQKLSIIRMTIISSSAIASEDINFRCWDGSFSYDTISVESLEDTLVVGLQSGAYRSIITQHGLEKQNVSGNINMEVPKEDCHVVMTEDQRPSMYCKSENVMLTLALRRLGSGPDPRPAPVKVQMELHLSQGNSLSVLRSGQPWEVETSDFRATVQSDVLETLTGLALGLTCNPFN